MRDGVLSRTLGRLRLFLYNEDPHTFPLRYRRGEMPPPFELNSIEKGIHHASRTGGGDNLDANLFERDAVDSTYFYVRAPTAERLVLTQKSCYGWRRPYTASPSIIY